MNEDTPLQNTNLPPLINKPTEPINLTNLPLKIFSIIFEYMKWISSLRWYVIVLIVTVMLFVIFQFEHSIESRRQKKQLQKEGMQTEKTKGIIKENGRNNNSKKRVSFENDSSLLEYEKMSENDSIEKNKKVSTINETLTNVYNLWIYPWLYVLVRNVGFA
jgi:hypothetical protein